MALLLVIISVFVPWSPKMPGSSIDSSWATGLNQAIAQGLSFGKDILFTYGPWASVYTETYHPATDIMMVGGSLYLAVSWWLCVVFLATTWRWTLACGFLLGGMVYARDSLFFSYPLLVGILACKLVFPEPEPAKQNPCEPLIFALLFAPFGLLGLIKSSLLLTSLITALLCLIFFLLNRKKTLALICLFSPAIAMLLFWIGAGQNPANLPAWFQTTLLFTTSFTRAMALEGNQGEIILYLLTSVFILLVIACQKQPQRSQTLFLSSLFFIFLFLSFKSGFVRHNVHAFIPATSILMAALLLPLAVHSRLTIPVMIISLGTWAYIDNHYTDISLRRNFLSTATSAWYGLKNRINEKNWLKQDYELSMNYLKNQASIPLLHGTTDIYSCHQTWLISSGNNWSPRPVIQSYSVFTPALAEANRKHLLTATRPDNIIFKMEPIDNRLPALEDGASWPLLLTRYEPVALRNDFLFLARKADYHDKVMPLQDTVTETHEFGERVMIPVGNQPVFAEIELTPAFWGYLAITFLKPHALYIRLTLKNGIQRTYRLIPDMAKSVFLLSPLIENTNEFALLYDNKKLLDDKSVHAIEIVTSPGGARDWKNRYVLHLKQPPGSLGQS